MATKAKSAAQAFRSVQQRAEKIKSDGVQRFPDAASVGDAVRQGDLYITRMAAIPSGCVLVPDHPAQLAEGASQGSRHVLDALEGVEVFRRVDEDALQGPLLRISVERTVTHPEHGDWVLPAGCYEITYQRQFADELRRVTD